MDKFKVADIWGLGLSFRSSEVQYSKEYPFHTMSLRQMKKVGATNMKKIWYDWISN